MKLNALKTLTTAALIAASSAASAGTSPFTLVSGATAPGVDVTLTVQESTIDGYDYDFVVSNNSLSGTVTGVYFEMLWNGKMSGAGAGSGPADLNPGSLSPDIDGWMGAKSSHTVGQTVETHWIARGRYYNTYHDIIEDGIHGGQAQVFSFMTDTEQISLTDLEDVLGAEGFGVAIRLQDITSDPQEEGFGLAEGEPLFQVVSLNSQLNQEQGQVTGAPTPTAAFAGLSMLGIIGLRRRRRNG